MDSFSLAYIITIISSLWLQLLIGGILMRRVLETKVIHGKYVGEGMWQCAMVENI